MKIIYFSKYDQELSVKELGEKITRMGFDGIDLAVRPSHPVNPENVHEALPQAERRWNSQGTEATMITTNFDFLNPEAPEAEQLYAACSEAGVKWVKLAYWTYEEGQSYWEEVDKIRKALAGFEKLSRKYGVKTCYHTHSGPSYGSNCAGLMHLLEGSDPKYIGAYIDTGHLVLDGEDYGMGLAMVKDYLSLVALKDVVYVKGEENGKLVHELEFVKLGNGLVPWEKFFASLLDTGYDGPLSIHGDYEVDKRVRDKWVQEDLAFVRRILQEHRKR